jgi:hypothetical protein
MGAASRRRRMAGAPAPSFDAKTGEPLPGKYAGQRLAEYAAELVAWSHRGGGDRQVPCGTCRECCWHSVVEVSPERGDDASKLDTVQRDDGQLILRKRPDGSCVHLGPQGCEVREHRPMVCRRYDCRVAGAAGLGERYEGGHRAPGWVFDLDTPTDRALALALRIGALRVVRPDGDFSAAEATKAAWIFAREHLPGIRGAIDRFDRLPPPEQRRAIAELAGLQGGA